MRRTLLLLSSLMFSTSLFGQTDVTTGIPPFASAQSSSFDSVNVGNLNANFTLPLVSTPGRGTGFNMALAYDTLIWQNNGTAWTPVTDHAGNAIWGWKTVAPVGEILYNYHFSSITHRCSVDYFDYKTTETYSNYIYRDVGGTTHYFPVSWTEVIDYCTGSDVISGTTSGYAGDGSGLYMDGIPGPGNVHTKSGVLLNTNSVDTNGNITTRIDVNANETDWKDSTGLIALRVVQNGSNTEYHYLDTTGADRLFTLKRQLYSIKTAFGCSGISDYNTAGTMPRLAFPTNWICRTAKYIPLLTNLHRVPRGFTPAV